MAHTLRLTNTGVVVDTYQVTVTGGAWPARGPSQVGPLEAGRGAALVVVVDIPAGSAAGANDVTSAVVASAGAPSQSEERLLTTVSNVVHGVDLQTGRSERTGARGGGVLYRLRVSNLGNVADTFGLAVVGSNWPVAAPASVGPLAPGGYADVTLVVSIPGSARAGQQDTANVTVTSWADPAQKDGLVLTTRVVLLYQVYDVYLPLVLRNR